MAVAALAAVASVAWNMRQPGSAPVVRFQVPPPEEWTHGYGR